MDNLYRDKYRILISSNYQLMESDCALECSVLTPASLHFNFLSVATLSQPQNNWLVLKFWKNMLHPSHDDEIWCR